MGDEVFRQRKTMRPPTQNEAAPANPLERVQQIQDAVSNDTGREVPNVSKSDSAPFEIQGTMPPEFRRALEQRINTVNDQEVEGNEGPFPGMQRTDPTFDHTKDTLNVPPEGRVRPKQKPKAPKVVPDTMVAPMRTSVELEHVLGKITDHMGYDELELPSRSKFYETIPPMIHIRPMTGMEENILATPRFVKKGKAVDMIFQNCIKEKIDTAELLSIDRTYLLIFLRGISYTPEYDVEVKCPLCGTKFNTAIDLNSLDVNMCPNDFGPDRLSGTLPTTKLPYQYRLATGEDEQQVSRHREMRIREYGDQAEDDTLLYRAALLLEYIDEVTELNDIMVLLKRLPVGDINYLRNVINDPPFGVDTEIGLICPSCNEDFEIALPFETDFFFPKKKEERTQA